jgi:hypothetical protein
MRRTAMVTPVPAMAGVVEVPCQNTIVRCSIIYQTVSLRKKLRFINLANAHVAGSAVAFLLCSTIRKRRPSRPGGLA